MTRRQLIAAVLLGLAIGLVVLPNVIWALYANGKSFEFSRPYALVCGLLPSVLALALLFGVLGRALWVGVLVLVPFLPIAPVETAYIAHYGEPSWYAIIATVVESNSREAIDYAGNAFWLLSAACLISFAIGIAAAVMLRRARLTWTGRSRRIALTAAISCIVAIAVFDTVLARSAPAGASKQGPAALPQASNFKVSFPFGMPLRLLEWYDEQRSMQQVAAGLREYRFHAHAARTFDQRRIHVLIIGEASRVDRWSLYGYGRETNPRLAGQPNLIRLSDVVTPWSASRMAIPIIVTRKKGADGHDWFNEPSILRVFSEAGFDTYWLSNQIAFGALDSPISVLAKEANHVAFFNVADYTNAGTYDDVLLEPLKQALQSGSQNLFIVLHTLGSHENYAYRYPEAFDKYKPSLKRLARVDFNNAAIAQEISNSYDNSILYTDHFIAEVIASVDATPALSTVWYVADHGEDLINASCNLTSHGSGTVYNFRVPSVFWYSDSYAAAFAPELRRLRQHSDQPLTTENLFESLIDMAGVTIPERDAAWSVFSDEWQPHRRIVNPLYGEARLDFDHAGESKNCHMLTAESRGSAPGSPGAAVAR